MTLIKSISGIRGTIGGSEGDNLTPLDIVRFTAAYGQWLLLRNPQQNIAVVIGRDARKSGAMLSSLVSATLQGMGINVIDTGLSTTPTVEMTVVAENARGGIILTASHNPAEWNALKLLNEKGEFISGADGEVVLQLAEPGAVTYATVEKLGKLRVLSGSIDNHINAILKLPLVNVAAIEKANFTVVVDAVNSTGGISVLPLLAKLGVKNVHAMYCEPTGDFPHNPEPLPENLTEISSQMVQLKASLGIVVDPDVDRLALVCEDGSLFGEEYTLVAVADYVLSHTPGNTVSNLSSTRALHDVTVKRGGKYAASAVGEVNVVQLMKETRAIIGGEGNGGIIYPELHYGRDALAGIALFLSQLALSGQSASQLRASFPPYFMSKNKIIISGGMDVDEVLRLAKERYQNERISIIDGVKIDFADSWVHLRKSNTEPIIRIYTEANSQEKAIQLANEFITVLKEIIG
jgi:phosphomannomutase